MSDDVSLENTVRQYVILPNQPSRKGWWAVKCEVCHDRKKRGAWKFDSDSTCYKCFNCDVLAVHTPSQYATVPHTMVEVLNAFGIPPDEYSHLAFNALKHRGDHTQHVPTDPDTKLIEIPLPEHFGLLEHATDMLSDVAREYLTIDRLVNPESYPFYILDSEKQKDSVEHKWRGRLIIPYFRQNRLVWYQGRDLNPNSKLRYLNAETESECVLSNYDVLFKNRDDPLYICEGFFDSFMLNGVGIFGNKFKAGQIKLLQKSPRPKVYIPDLSGDGHIAALQAIQLGWSVSVPKFGAIKDVNAACVKYGRLYVKKTIVDNTLSGFQAEMRVNILCRQKGK